MIVEESIEVDESRAEKIIKLLGDWRFHVIWTTKLPSGKRRIVYRRFDDEQQAG